MKGFWLALASVISALAATLCCLPALLFLIFGASFSLLSSQAIESLTELRPYFTALNKILSILLLASVAFANQNFVIKVEGMHCPLCTAMVRKALLKVEGVISAKASLHDKTARVETKDGVSEKQLLDAVATTGYTGEIVE